MNTFDKSAALARVRRATITTACGDLPVRTPTLAEFRKYVQALTQDKDPAKQAQNDLELIQTVAETPEGARVFATPEEVDRALNPEECLEVAKAVRDLIRGPDPQQTR